MSADPQRRSIYYQNAGFLAVEERLITYFKLAAVRQ
jgi:hypothetical protein